MKKALITLFTLVILFGFFSICSTGVYALEEKNVLETETNSKIIELKNKELRELADYEELYGSKSYGLTAYILNKVRVFSIPFCFIGIAVGSIFQYVIGIRRLDIRDRGFALIITFVTILIVCQVLPLIFALITHGWRG